VVRVRLPYLSLDTASIFYWGDENTHPIALQTFLVDSMKSFEQLLAESTSIHGHLCAGQVIGVRMSMAALDRIGIADPKGADRKKLYVLVEIDRCATDAIQSVTGCSLGKRSLRWLDFGVMAATFVNLETGRSVRVIAREEARALSEGLLP
jgi:formylmethanofuran dehydrogenase subunit E